MKKETTIKSRKEEAVKLSINVTFTDNEDVSELQAYAFTTQGKFLDSNPVRKGAASVVVPASLNGQPIEVILGPVLQAGQPVPSAGVLKRMGAYALAGRFLVEKPRIDLNIPGRIIPKWCLCVVKGRLIKRYYLPDGTIGEQPICNARVHICEVDRIPLVIGRIPDPDIFRLRDDLIDQLHTKPPFPWPPIPEEVYPPWPPIPGPGPDPFNPVATHSMALQAKFDAPISNVNFQRKEALSISLPALKANDQETVRALQYATSASQIRAYLIDLAPSIHILLCHWFYFWGLFKKDCITAVEVDDQGRFTTLIGYPCSDQPDLYFWVEQFQNGSWVTVYKPSIGCGTHWNYSCGSEVEINIPAAIGCEQPNYDLPPGVTLFVLPYSIGYAPIWGIPTGSPPAPNGWVRPDGYLNYYHSSSSLGWIYDAPFGGTLHFYQDDSYFIPSSGIKYYRYSYRRVGDPDWTPITTPLGRGYRMEYSDRLPTYESYPIGPVTVGTESNLFEFKPQQPPFRATDPASVVAREWTSGNLSEVAAAWDTTLTSPPLSITNTTDDAGDFDVKIEVFDPAGVQVLPGASTFRFLLRNADGSTTRLATPAEEAGGAYVMRVHLDNNSPTLSLPQPSIYGVSASDDCGFLRYETGDQVHIQYVAAHPNDHAVFRFHTIRGSNLLAAASTLNPYVEVSSATAPTTSSPFIKSGAYYQRDFAPNELLGSCVNAAFAEHLYIFGKVTNGRWRLGNDTSRIIAYALAEQSGA
jgi:hypothetical protein